MWTIKTWMSRVVVAVVVILVAACGDAAAPDVESPDASVPDATNGPSLPGLPDSIWTPVTTVTSQGDVTEPTIVLGQTTTTTQPPVEPSEDPFGPSAGEEIGVIGVAFDDVLNVRLGPGIDQTIVATLDPLSTTTATGRHKMVGAWSMWWEVAVGEKTGWANSSYLSRLSEPIELAAIDTSLITGTLEELGRAVVEDYVRPLEDAGVESSVTLALEPRGEHDLGEVVFDVTGYGDDSESGIRLHVYGRPTDDRQSFQLLRVEATTMCWRGVFEGRCA